MAGSFSADLSRFCKKYDADVKTVVRKISFEAFKRIILRTPVDTGRARANWGVAAGQPNVTYQIEGTDKSGSATLQKTAEGVNSWLCQGSIFMTNNLPYIGTLEYGGYPTPPKSTTGKTAGGYSIQAPQGMVRLTVEEMHAWISNAANVKESMTSIRSRGET